MVYQIKHITHWKQAQLTKNPINNKKDPKKFLNYYWLLFVLGALLLDQNQMKMKCETYMTW